MDDCRQRNSATPVSQGRRQTFVGIPDLSYGAGNETRTRDHDLGKVVLYQLSYSRIQIVIRKMEAWVGIEPAYTALQAAA